ncbi:MAG: translocation/assembly module TamB domain-containing protein [candidate division WOR-3 bacterium]
MKVKRLLIFFLVLIFICILICISYNFAIWKTKKDIEKRLEEFLIENVEIEGSHIDLSGFYFKNLKTRWFQIKGFNLDFNLFALVFFKNAGSLDVEYVELNLDSLISFVNKKLKLEKKEEKESIGTLILFIDNALIRKIKLTYRNREYFLENFKFSLNIQGEEYQIKTFFTSPSIYNLICELSILGKGKYVRIFTKNFKSELFEFNLKADLKERNFLIVLNDSKIKNYFIKNAYIEGSFNENVIEIKRMDVISDIFNITTNFKFKDNTLKGFLQGSFVFDNIKSSIKSNFFIDIKRETFSGDILLTDFIYKDFKFNKIFYRGSISKNFYFDPDSFDIRSDFLESFGKKEEEGITFKIEKMSQEILKKLNSLNFINKFDLSAIGSIRIKEKDFDMIAQGIVKDILIKDFLIDTLNFTCSRNEGINNVNFYSKELNFKGVKMSLDLLGLFFSDFDSINFILKGIFPFLGSIEEEGVFIKKDKREKIKLNHGFLILSPSIDISFDSLKFLNGFSKIKKENEFFYFNLKEGDLSYIPFLDLKGELNSEVRFKIEGNFPVLVDGKINVKNLFYKFLNIDTFNFSFISSRDSIKGNGYFISNRKAGKLNLDYHKENYNFEIYGNDFNINDFNIFVKDLFNLEKGDYDFNFKGNIKNKKFDYIAEVNCENVSGVFYPVALNFNNTHIYLVFRNDTFLYDFTGLSGNGRLRGSGIGKLGLDGNGFSVSGKVSLREVDIYPIPNIEADVNGEIVYKEDQRGLYIEGELLINKAFIYPYFEEEALNRFSKTSINLNLKGENIFITSEYLNAELRGNLSILSPDFTRKVFKGRFDVKRGNIFYLGRIFDIRGNSYVELKGEDKFDPELFIEAETYYFNPVNREKVKIIVITKGKLSAPQFSLRSDPPVYTETELFKMLTFGSELIGSNLIEGTVSTEIRKRLKIKELLITGLLKGDPVFTVGTYVSEKVYLKYSQALYNPSRNLYLIKYFILPTLSIYTEKDEKGSLQSGLEFEFRF